MNLEIIKCENGMWKIGPNGVCRWKTKKMAHAARTHFKVELRRLEKEEDARRERV